MPCTCRSAVSCLSCSSQAGTSTYCARARINSTSSSSTPAWCPRHNAELLPWFRTRRHLNLADPSSRHLHTQQRSRTTSDGHLELHLLLARRCFWGWCQRAGSSGSHAPLQRRGFREGEFLPGHRPRRDLDFSCRRARHIDVHHFSRRRVRRYRELHRNARQRGPARGAGYGRTEPGYCDDQGNAYRSCNNGAPRALAWPPAADVPHAHLHSHRSARARHRNPAEAERAERRATGPRMAVRRAQWRPCRRPPVPGRADLSVSPAPRPSASLFQPPKTRSSSPPRRSAEIDLLKKWSRLRRRVGGGWR